MIPKRIFYVWGINDEKKRDVQVCIQTWRQYLPDYEIIEINENSKEYFDFQKELQNNKWFKTVYERKMYAFVADYIRVKVLYENGGIYLDTDVSVVKPFDSDLLTNPAFVGIQSGGKDSLTEPAILGAQQGNKFLKEILKFYNQQIWTEPIYTIPEIFKYYIEKMYSIKEFPLKNMQKIIYLKDITLYPEKYFIPFEFGEKFSPECVEQETYTIHWFGGSWVNPEILHFLKHKHLEKFETYVPTKKYLLFSFIPLIKIIEKSNSSIIYLFHIIPLLKITKIKNQQVIKFWEIPFLTIQYFPQYTKIRFLNLFTILKIKH